MSSVTMSNATTRAATLRSRKTNASAVFALGFAVGSLACSAGSTDANAKRYPICKAPMEASATSTGILGAGTREARRIARYNFESAATDRYGFQYGNLDKARNVRWDCKKGAILQAKCIVTARPCHQ